MMLTRSIAQQQRSSPQRRFAPLLPSPRPPRGKAKLSPSFFLCCFCCVRVQEKADAAAAAAAAAASKKRTLDDEKGTEEPAAKRSRGATSKKTPASDDEEEEEAEEAEGQPTRHYRFEMHTHTHSSCNSVTVAHIEWLPPCLGSTFAVLVRLCSCTDAKESDAEETAGHNCGRCR